MRVEVECAEDGCCGEDVFGSVSRMQQYGITKKGISWVSIICPLSPIPPIQNGISNSSGIGNPKTNKTDKKHSYSITIPYSPFGIIALSFQIFSFPRFSSRQKYSTFSAGKSRLNPSINPTGSGNGSTTSSWSCAEDASPIAVGL